MKHNVWWVKLVRSLSQNQWDGEDITTDLINGLHRFKDAARWKVYFKLLQEEKDKENQSN